MGCTLRRLASDGLEVKALTASAAAVNSADGIVVVFGCVDVISFVQRRVEGGSGIDSYLVTGGFMEG